MYLPSGFSVRQVITRQAPTMEAALSASLLHCPADAWQAISPQLFAQLANPQPAVRRAVGALLRMLGRAVPVAVLYPAVVGGRVAVEAGEGLAAHPELQVNR